MVLQMKKINNIFNEIIGKSYGFVKNYLYIILKSYSTFLFKFHANYDILLWSEIKKKNSKI